MNTLHATVIWTLVDDHIKANILAIERFTRGQPPLSVTVSGWVVRAGGDVYSTKIVFTACESFDQK